MLSKKKILILIPLLLSFISQILPAKVPYRPFVITVTDEVTGKPVPLVNFQTVNKISYYTDKNGQIAFYEPGLMGVGDVYFYIKAPYGYQAPEKDTFGNQGKTLKPVYEGRTEITLKPDPSPEEKPEYSKLESFRLKHAYNVTNGSYSPFEIKVIDSDSGRGVPLVELKTKDDLSCYTDSAGRIAFYEPDLMGTKVFFYIKSYGYKAPEAGGVELTITPDGKAEVKIKRENIAERLYRITGEGIYDDSVKLGLPVPLKNPVLCGKVMGQDTVDMTEYKGRLFWLWGDTDRPVYPLGNFKTSCAISELPGKGGLQPDEGVDLKYYVNKEGFCEGMFPFEGANLVWMNTLVSVKDNNRKEKLVGSYAFLNSEAKVYETGFAVFNDDKQVFEKLAKFEDNHNVRPTGQADKKDGYVYGNCPYPTVRIKADLDSLRHPETYESFTCLEPGTKYDEANSRVERDKNNKLVWGWKKNTSPLNDVQWKTMAKEKLVDNSEAWNLVKDVNTGEQVLPANGSAGYNNYRKCWVMIIQQQFGSSFLGEIWIAAAQKPEGPWTKAVKIVTHASKEDMYTFYNPSYHPEFNQDNGRFIYFEGTYTSSYTDNKNPTARYNYNQIMYKVDLSDSKLNAIWP